jgi:four helix bundle protein
MDAASTDRNMTFFRFEDLRIYHKSLEYVNWVHKASAGFPDTVHDNIGTRFNEAARSITLNIAEGSARNKSQFIYYLKMAKSALRESLVLTSAVKKFGYLTDEQEAESRNYLMELTKMIGALISSLQKSSPSRNETDETEDEPRTHTGQYHPEH